MSEKEIIEAEVIEPEILDENGRPVNETPPPPKSAVLILRGIVALVFTFLVSVVMALFALMIFLPMLVIKAFAKRGNNG